MVEELNNENNNVQKVDNGENGNQVAVDAPVDASTLPLDQRASVTDINDKARKLTFTEKNNQKIELQLQAPTIEQGDYIDSKRSVFVPDDNGETAVVRLNNKEFHEALFGIFNQNYVLIDGKPSGKPVDWNFFNNHSREFFNWTMKQANRFLENLQ